VKHRILCPRCLADNDDEARCRKCHASLNLAMLHIAYADATAHTVTLRPRTYTIGRSPEADIVLPDGSVSRVHARIDYQRGAFVIEDNGSRHGVHVDGARVERVALTAGSTVQIGTVALRFSLLDAEASTGGLDLPAEARASGRTASVLATETLDQLRHGVVLLTAKGKVSFANRSARAILDEADGLSLERGRLRASDPAAASHLEELLGAQAGDESPRGGALALPRPSGRRPLALLVTRLSSRGFPGGRAVFLSDPDRGISAGEETLVRLHGLTRAEAALAIEMLKGRSVEAASAELGITVLTARTHLKRVFAKTKTRRQSELVLLLLNAAPPLHDE
jgi:DNA-binding CsgD family transcriptional regulator